MHTSLHVFLQKLDTPSNNVVWGPITIFRFADRKKRPKWVGFFEGVYLGSVGMFMFSFIFLFNCKLLEFS